MRNEVTTLNSFTRQLQVEVPWEELQEQYGVFLQRFSKKVRLPGFRKGKVPQKMVRQQFAGSVEAEFAEQSVQQNYLEALKDSALEPINQATIRGVQFKEGSPLRFEATFEVEPEVQLPPYKKGLKLERIEFDQDEEDVARAVEELRQQQAELRTVEGGLEEGHYLLADLQEVDPGGMPLVGRKLENQYLHLNGEGPLGSENLPKLTGAQVGDTRRVTLTAEGGGPAHFDLTVKEVSERLLPDVDDAFARQVDPRAENLAELEENLRGKIAAALKRESNKQLSRSIADHFVRSAQLEVPTSLFENFLDSLMADLERGAYGGGQIDREAVREEQRASITWNLKWFLLRKQLILEEQIEVDEEAVDARINELSQADESQSSQVRNHYRRPENRRALKDELVAEALTQRLLSYAKVKTVHKPSREPRQGA
ncbi:MAG: trigger factor [Candidatus Neomarinimicrobiota bacterium]